MEDIGFLNKKSNKESYLFFVDSVTRNVERYPEPNKYSIEFNSPFKNVYSLEVIDASIPRTQYSIDLHTNLLKYTYNDINYEIYVNIGDYTDQLLISELNSKFESNNTAVTVENLSNPPSIRNSFVFKGNLKFSIDATNSTIGEIIGFGTYGKYTSSQNEEHFASISVLDDFSDDSYTFGISDTTILYQQIVTNYSGYIQQININIASSKPITVNVCIGYYELNDFVVIENSLKTFNIIETGDIINRYVIHYNENNVFIGNVPMYFIKIYFTNKIDSTIVYISNHLINVNQNQLYYKYNTADSSVTILPISYINVYDEINELYHTDPLYVTTFASNNPTDIRLSMDIELFLNVAIESITAPGMYSLIGDRYVILRCPEIEDHMFRSRAFEKYNMGLAKFKMAVLGYGQERFDYNGLPPRKFHPIGKLDKLSFRFERADGSLYNFRGINHTITFLIKYLTPTQKDEPTYSRLNPYYNPDFLEYIQNEKSDTDDSSDDEEKKYVFENPQKYFFKI